MRLRQCKHHMHSGGVCHRLGDELPFQFAHGFLSVWLWRWLRLISLPIEFLIACVEFTWIQIGRARRKVEAWRQGYFEQSKYLSDCGKRRIRTASSEESKQSWFCLSDCFYDSKNKNKSSETNFHTIDLIIFFPPWPVLATKSQANFTGG